MKTAGILSLLKPAGMTSHDCVVKIRKLFQTKKVGHTGTLDPAVTGVLPICIGQATKVAEYMSDYAKAYEAEVTLGIATTTEDQTGEMIEQVDIDQLLTNEQIDATLKTFQGEITQIPPMYSAVKVNGRRLYDYARKNEVVERPKRLVNIYEIIRLDDVQLDQEAKVIRFRISVLCSKGTYVRTLAVDIGKKLGLPAHMSKLIRTSSGPFLLDDCITLEELENFPSVEERYRYLLPLDRAIAHLPSYTVDEEIEQKIKFGSVLTKDKSIEESRFTFYNREGQCLAIYQDHPTKEGLIKPEKMLFISAGQ
ncbi:tRNA pseudouridine(55) synthase TruB [Alkalihalobacillus pseudalcaliphilus]|uniref:tRNA pseudouridine(55) synthase TruB n=1 Tax=Alkalihalobacillus pseudalcaliphilus TaxID=79884 RepID=UPI00064E089B|nr:tRNA pseudouridine(55) synthase TruB [Alkalihalobacillus pseudalcaliphilus]KMK77258.1 tRNA pseudouridine synthase B [Alkalihalobacillus pseudalcaliphilus]